MKRKLIHHQLLWQNKHQLTAAQYTSPNSVPTLQQQSEQTANRIANKLIIIQSRRKLMARRVIRKCTICKSLIGHLHSADVFDIILFWFTLTPQRPNKSPPPHFLYIQSLAHFSTVSNILPIAFINSSHPHVILNISHVTEHIHSMYCKVVPLNCTKTPVAIGACFVSWLA